MRYPSLWLGVFYTLYLWRHRHGTTPPFLQGPEGDVVKGSIAEIIPVDINQTQQWLIIRGRDRQAPLLIWLSGGPGLDTTFLLRSNQAVLEDHYLVVYWTQRGAGRSLLSSLDCHAMTLDNYIQDLHYLIDYLHDRFGREKKVVLVGHSWGSALGLSFVHRYPHRIVGFVGISQVINLPESEGECYYTALDRARVHGDDRTEAALLAVGPPPHPAHMLLKQRQLVSPYVGAWYQPIPHLHLLLKFMSTHEATWYDVMTALAGFQQTITCLWSELSHLDFTSPPYSMTIPVPIALFEGKHDVMVSSRIAAEYWEAIEAPKKVLVFFNESGHWPQVEEPQQFNEALLQVLGDMTDIWPVEPEPL